MRESQQLPNVWQYHLIWTPGPYTSQAQLWAATRMGTRNLWDTWETDRFVGTPAVHDVLHALYTAAVEAHERTLHIG